MKPIILVTSGVENTYRGLVQSYCYKTYSEAIGKSGGIALIAADDSDIEGMADLADGLYLTGGNDIDPGLYGGAYDYSEELDPWRDKLELRLFHAFYKRGKPIFGICRGMQLINVALGGSLYEDMEIDLGISHPMVSTHMVHAKPGSELQRWFGESFLVNSFHHQAIDRLGEGLEVTAWTDDHVIESVAHKKLPIFAMQWHPERMTGDDPFTPIGPDMKPLFDGFCALCEKYKTKHNRIA